jgi:Flp pilus assembly protein TadG
VRVVGDFRRSQSGSVAAIFALGLPALFGLVGVAVDYSSFVSQRVRLQKAADAAALATTSELSVSSPTDAQLQAIAERIVNSLVPQGFDGAIATTTRMLAARNGVNVVLRQQKQAIMSRFVSPTLTDLEVSATASLASSRKVCFIGLDTTQGKTSGLDARAQVTARDCDIYSNSREPTGISVLSSARLSANLICSAGGFEGSPTNYSGQKVSDCPRVEDPLANRPPPPVLPCKESQKLVVESDRIITPGTYCGGIEIKNKARVTLNSGIYVIKDGQLKVDDDASLYGREVGIYFAGSSSQFDFLSSSKVDLGAPRDGPMAGILFYGDRSAAGTTEYKITSDNARTLLGTIYLPKASSPWTLRTRWPTNPPIPSSSSVAFS